jgi:hypothetical protein
MFNQSVDQRLTEWINCRNTLEVIEDPLQYVWDFWHPAPFIPYNKNIDPYFKRNWPSPWEIIAENKYDDFTRALMISWTLKLTKKFNQSKIEIKTLVDSEHEREYNLVFVDDNYVINYSDNGPVSVLDLIGSFRLQNLIEVDTPR